MANITEDCCLHCCGQCHALYLDINQFLDHKMNCNGVVPQNALVAVQVSNPEIVVQESQVLTEAEHMASIDQNSSDQILDVAANHTESNGHGSEKTVIENQIVLEEQVPIVMEEHIPDIMKACQEFIVTEDFGYSENTEHHQNLEDFGISMSDLGFEQNVETIEITVADDTTAKDDDGSIVLHLPNEQQTLQLEMPPLDHINRVQQCQSQRYMPKNEIPKHTDYHVRMESGDEVLFCNYCQYKTKHFFMLSRHLSMHNEGGVPFSCDKCKYTSMFRGVFQAHLKKHERSLQCDHCSYRTHNQRDLNRHNLRHTKQFPFQCSECDKLFRQKSTLEIHMRTHTGRLFKCGIGDCQYETPNKSTLKAHQRRRHGVDRQNYACEIDGCDYVACDVSTFQNHMKTHLGLKDNRCPYCEYTSVLRSEVRKHMKLHLSEKLYHCDKCSFQTSHPSALRFHLMKHVGLKPYSCGAEGCDYKTSTKWRVQQHIESIHPNQNTQIVFDGTSLKIDFESYRNKNVQFPDGDVIKIKFGTEATEAITVDENEGIGTVSRFNQIVVENLELDDARIECVQCDLCKFQCRSKASLASHRITCHEENISTNHVMDTVAEGGVIDALATVQAQMDVETCV